MKTCKKCGGTRRYSSGECANCEKLRTRKRYADNPERKKKIQANYRLNNLEKTRMKNREWAKNNREQARLNTSNWKIEHPEKKIAQDIKRRSIKKNAMPKWFGELDELIIEEAANLCKLREKATKIKWHVDHIIPLQSKIVCGLHIGSNIQVLPATTNMSKGNRHWPNMP